MELLDGFRDVIRDPLVCSETRVREVQEGVRYAFDTAPINPADQDSGDMVTAIYRLISAGELVNDEDYRVFLPSITVERAREWVSELIPEDAHTVIFKGLGK